MILVKEAHVLSTVIFSEDHKHRFLLNKIWDSEKKSAAIIMINPSFADELKIDTTVMKVRNFLVDHNFGSMSIVNLFSFISSNPDALAGNTDSVRPETDKYINETVQAANTIIIAWGSDKSKYVKRKKEVWQLLLEHQQKVKCFKCKDNKMGRHPSRLGKLELCDFIK